MGTWAPQNLGSNLSAIVSTDDTQDDAVRSHERGTVTPPYPVIGQLWARTDYPVLGEALMYNKSGGTFALFCDPEAAQINASGTIAFAADQPMGNHKLTGLAAGTANGDSVRYEQVLLLTGGTMTGSIVLSGAATISGFGAAMDMNGQKIGNLAAPSASGDAARKADVDKAAPAAGTFTTTTGATASATITLGYQPSHLLITLDMASPADVITLQAPGSAASETLGALYASGRISISITRTGTGFTVSFTNPHSGTAWAGRYLAWKA